MSDFVPGDAAAKRIIIMKLANNPAFEGYATELLSYYKGQVEPASFYEVMTPALTSLYEYLSSKNNQEIIQEQRYSKLDE